MAGLGVLAELLTPRAAGVDRCLSCGPPGEVVASYPWGMAEQQSAGRRWAARIGRVGIWANLEKYSAPEERAIIWEIEELGYGAFWYPEGAGGKECFAHASWLLGSSQEMVIASGIANLWARDPIAMANGARVLHEAYGRFLLGVGVSHRPAVAARGANYDKPFERMRSYVEAMDAAPYNGPQPDEAYPRVLAALGPRMLKFSADKTLGAHPYFVPVEHTEIARAALGPDALLAPEQAVVVDANPTTARATARKHMTRYLTLTNYTSNLRRLGWTDEDISNGGSDALVDAVVAWGDEGAIASRVSAHLARGADHVCLQILEGDGAPSLMEQARALAPVVQQVGQA